MSDSVPLSPSLSHHAAVRMQQRGIKTPAVQAALHFGRRIHAKGLTYCVLGRKEVRRHAERGVDLSDFEGVQVLVSHEGTVVTVYRSHDLHAIKASAARRRAPARH